MTNDRPLQIGGMVLCGGESSRMGRPKAWLDLAGEPLLLRVVRVLRSAVDPVVVVAAQDQPLPPLDPAVEIARDAQAGLGPLQGLASGFAALQGRCDAVFVTACDVPWLSNAFIRRMVELLGDHQAATPVIDGQHYPLSSVYRIEVRTAVDRLLTEDRRSPRQLLEQTRCRAVQRHELTDIDPELLSLKDLTSPEDYENARRAIFLNSEF